MLSATPCDIFIVQDKYRSDFYYIAPNYHRAFTSLDRAVFIDATDLEFTIDVKGWDKFLILTEYESDSFVILCFSSLYIY